MFPAPLHPGWGCLLPGTVPGRAQVSAGGPVMRKLPHHPYGKAGERVPGLAHLRAAPAPSTNTAAKIATHAHDEGTLASPAGCCSMTGTWGGDCLQGGFGKRSTRSEAYLFCQHVWCLGSHGLCCSTTAGHLLPWGGLRRSCCHRRGRRSRQDTVLQSRQQPWACTDCVDSDAQAAVSKAVS